MCQWHRKLAKGRVKADRGLIIVVYRQYTPCSRQQFTTTKLGPRVPRLATGLLVTVHRVVIFFWVRSRVTVTRLSCFNMPILSQYCLQWRKSLVAVVYSGRFGSLTNDSSVYYATETVADL